MPGRNPGLSSDEFPSSTTSCADEDAYEERRLACTQIQAVCDLDLHSTLRVALSKDSATDSINLPAVSTKIKNFIFEMEVNCIIKKKQK